MDVRALIARGRERGWTRKEADAACDVLEVLLNDAEDATDKLVKPISLRERVDIRCRANEKAGRGANRTEALIDVLMEVLE